VPSAAIRARLQDRLEDLHARYAASGHDGVEKLYDAHRGSYPPEEAGDELDRLAICITTVDGGTFAAGDHDVPFPLQSMSKVFAYALALTDHDSDALADTVGVEPSGDAFNSITFDERHNRPFNPMVNAGAMATTSLTAGDSPEERLERILAVMRACAGDDDLRADDEDAAAELRGADQNRATAYLMRAQGMIDGDVEKLLELYLRQCSVKVTCATLATMAATLANGCVHPTTGERAVPRERVRDLLSVMYTCGMYDSTGEWAYDVGLPAKSGVSGGILVVVPGKMGIGVWSPGLDAYGNSARGVAICGEISRKLGLHLFATDDEDRLLAEDA
jgi:glutaminase